MKKSAFTLVELAIVLVILGLLAGGIVGGQSLIESSKTNSIISDYKKYNTAFNAFKLEYDAIPGDMANATDYWGAVATGCTTATGTGTQTCNGNGDKKIGYGTHEMWRVWQHLSNAQIIPSQYTGVKYSTSVYSSLAGINAPKGSIEGTAWAAMYERPTDGWTGKNVVRHFLGLGNPTNRSDFSWWGKSLTPKQARIIDSKADDGQPHTGKITMMSGSYSDWAPECAVLNNIDQPNTTYDLTYTTPECVPLFDLDI